MSTADWLAVGLLLALPAALAGAFFLYLRTAYRKGGWRAARISLLIAIGAIAALFGERIVENVGLEHFKDAVNRWSR
jgi:cation transport ATPase